MYSFFLCILSPEDSCYKWQVNYKISMYSPASALFILRTAQNLPHTYCRYHCGHPPDDGCRGSLLQYPGSKAQAYCFPVQFLACISHFIINISCTRDAFGNVIGRVSRNLRSDDALFYIIYIWQCQMFGRCYVAKECSPFMATTAPPMAACNGHIQEQYL